MIRQITHAGEDWVNVNDLRDAMNDNELILKDDAVESIRLAIAYFFTEATGALRHLEN